MTPPSVSPQFAHSIAANAAHWLRRTRGLLDADFRALDADRGNLSNAIRFGLALPETQRDAALLLTQLFEYIEVRGDWQAWLSFMEKVLPSLGDDHLRLKILYQSGFLYRRMGDHDRARAHYQQAMSLADQAGDPGEAAYIRFFWADLFYALHDHALAENYSRTALAGLEAAGEVGPKYGALLNLSAMIHHARGNHALAQATYQKALPIWRASQRTIKLAITLDNLSISFKEEGKFEDAFRCLEEALALLETTGNRLGAINAQISRGSLYFSMGDFAEAEKIFRRVDVVYLYQTAHRYQLGLTFNNLGSAVLESSLLEHDAASGRFEEAASYLERALHEWRTLANQPLMLANTAGDLAKTLEWSDPERALLLYDEAISLFSNFPQDDWAQKQRLLLLERRQALFIKMGNRP